MITDCYISIFVSQKSNRSVIERKRMHADIWVYEQAILNVVITLTKPIFTKPSPCLSISTSPSTASVPLRSFILLSCSSSACIGKGAGSSRTSNIRMRFVRATTTLHKALAANSWRVDELGGVGRTQSRRVDGVNLRLVANSTPLGGRIS